MNRSTCAARASVVFTTLRQARIRLPASSFSVRRRGIAEADLLSGIRKTLDSRSLLALALGLLLIPGAGAREVKVTCGTHPDRWKEELHLHEQANRPETQAARSKRLGGAVQAAAPRPDIGNLAMLEDVDGVIERRNLFNLNGKTLRFLPANAAAAYRYETGDNSYDEDAAANGVLIEGIKDDDSRELSLPFEFPFFGELHRRVFINSDGNATFTSADGSSSERSLGRLTGGPPRVAAFFRDLDPERATGGIRVFSEPLRYVISWVEVPEYREFGAGPPQTFQLRLYRDGRIEIAFSIATSTEAVVGISPGSRRGSTTVVSFLNDPSEEYGATVAERFSSSEELDIFTAAQKFYQNHDDAYDYLAFYNTLGIGASSGAVAFEVTLRNQRSGYGDHKIDVGAEAGSKRRLQAILNMGPVEQYPPEPDAPVPGRPVDTPLTVLGHEVGHLFLAYASIRDEDNAAARPMLGRQLAHWAFNFNSEASLLEGNRIEDAGESANPRFKTVAASQGYSPLDQYLMGFIPREEVPDTFIVRSATVGSARAPQLGVTFNGERRNISVDEIAAVEGRRTPDHTVSQRRFRLALVLVIQPGETPTQAVLDQIDAYRRGFEAEFSKWSGGHAVADTSLKRAVHLSAFPAAGVVEGGTATATIRLDFAPAAPLTVLLKSTSGAVQAPGSVTIPAGATQAAFTITGVAQGADDLIAEPADTAYATAAARIQVSSPGAVKLAILSGDKQPARSGEPLARPLEVRVTDLNELPYPGVQVQAALTGGGAVSPAAAVTDERGVANFRWTPGAGPANELRASLGSGQSITATALGRPVFAANSVVNAASFVAGLPIGGLATVFGANLAASGNPDVLIEGRAVPVFYADTRQVNFQVPPNLAEGTAEVIVKTATGEAAQRVPSRAYSPGIFFDAGTRFGAVLTSGTGQTTNINPVPRGGIIEIFATGLGPARAGQVFEETTVTPEVTVAGRPAEVLFSGLAPTFIGLYQVNAKLADSTPSGTQPLVLTAAGARSNEVLIGIR
ncbi:MAG: hypothetical protein HYS04_13970 [Acidobacteria bacterium]|nr:hypothetical protein [Acidobacteriota bacterium]